MRITNVCRIVLSGIVVLCVYQQANSQSATWNASIVSVTSEEPEFVSGQDWPGRPAGHRWMKLVVQLSSPGKKSTLPASAIRLSSQDTSYPATAVGYQVKPTDSIVYLPLLLVSPPHPDKGMKASQGKVKTGGGWSSLRSITPAGKFEETSTGFFEKMDINKMLFNVVLKGASGGRELGLMKSPLNMVFLFAVPEGLTDVQLRVGDGAAIPVPAVP
jgi:hypothetical protein